MNRRVKVTILIIVTLALLGGGITSYFLLKPHPVKATEPYTSSTSSLQLGKYQPPVTAEAITPEAILQDVNKARVANGEQPLVEDPLLMQAAQAKCDDMVANNYYGHQNPKTGQYIDAYARQIDPAIQYYAENLAGGVYPTNQTYVDAWLNSPGHKTNMLNPLYTQTGAATCVLPGTASNDIIAAQEFASVSTTTIAPGAICTDGWRSYSTGSGTCSHHDHVKVWLP